MSGSPVYDEALEGVVGVVSDVYYPESNSKNRDAAFAIPSEVLIEQFQNIFPEHLSLPVSQDARIELSSALRPKSKKTLGGSDYVIQSLIAQKNFGNMVIRAAKAGDKLMQESVGICQIEFINALPETQKEIYRNLRRIQNFNNAASNSRHLAAVRKIIPPSDKDLWVIYQWINGTSLVDYYPLSGPLPTKPTIKQLLTYCIDVCSGLAELHNLHEMHLGVMENTILIHKSLGVVLIDPCFVGMPVPIRAEQQLFDPKVDIYALGAILYRIMTHRIPQTQPPSKINPAIPPLLDQLLSEMLFGSTRHILDIRTELLRVRSQIN
jgi:serine/threonine protein kinase